MACDSKASGDGFDWKDGLSAVRSLQLDGGPQNEDLQLWRNCVAAGRHWPDGTELTMWSGATDGRMDDARNHVYGGAFAVDGSFLATSIPMLNMTEASGFGGIRRFVRGPGAYTRVAGVTESERRVPRVRASPVFVRDLPERRLRGPTPSARRMAECSPGSRSIRVRTTGCSPRAQRRGEDAGL